MQSSEVSASDDAISGEMTTLADRLKEVLDVTGLKSADLARLCGVTSSAVSQWMTRDDSKIKGEHAISIEEGTPFRSRWILEGRGPKFKGVDTGLSHTSKVLTSSKLPVRRSYHSRAGMGQLQIIAAHDPASSGGYVDAAVSVSSAAYAVRVRGDGFEPVLSDGWCIILDPDAAPQPGEWVLIEREDGEEMLCRLLYARADMVEFQSLDKRTGFSMPRSDITSMIAVAGTAPPSKWRSG